MTIINSNSNIENTLREEIDNGVNCSFNSYNHRIECFSK